MIKADRVNPPHPEFRTQTVEHLNERQKEDSWSCLNHEEDLLVAETNEQAQDRNWSESRHKNVYFFINCE